MTRRSALRKALFTIHLYLATVIGVFVVIFGVTGSIMAFGPELDRLLHGNPASVRPAQKPLSIAELHSRITEVIGDMPLSWTMSEDPKASWQVFNPRIGTYRVNPYTGELLGSRMQSRDFLGWVVELHTGLRHESYVARAVMDCANVLAVFVLISGVYLWWPLKRITIKGSVSGRRLWFDVHSTVGILFLVFVSALSLTGIVIAYGADLVPLAARALHPQLESRPRAPIPPAEGKPISADRALEIARACFPNAVPVGLNPPLPGFPKAAYTVLMHDPGDPFAYIRLFIDHDRGAVLSIEEPQSRSLEARIVDTNLAIHTGQIFGLPGRAVMSAASFMVVVEAATGLVMWWKRRRLRERARLYRSVSRSPDWQSLP